MPLLQIHIQANLYGMGRDSDLFDDPLSYKPERWTRLQSNTTNDPSDEAAAVAADLAEEQYRLQQLVVNLVFGHGSRMCLGS